jgi:hypothetical protein
MTGAILSTSWADGNTVHGTDLDTITGQINLLTANSQKSACVAATTGSETFTIASGSVTVISGTTVDGVSPNVDDRILVKDAPAASGAGSVGSTQPGNGIYYVTNNTTNLSLSRVADMSAAILPVGAEVAVSGGTANADTGWIVSSPSTTASFTYGTNNIAWVAQIIAGTGLTRTGNTLAVNTPLSVANGGTGAASIPTWNQNTTGSAATLTTPRNINGVAFDGSANIALGSTTPTASTLAQWDANVNLSANAFVESSTSTAMSGGTLTMSITSTQVQIFTGSSSTGHTVKLPTTSVSASADYVIINQNSSTGTVAVQSSGANAIATLAPGTVGVFTAQKATPTAATDWVGDVTVDGKTLIVDNSLELAGTDGTKMTFPSSSDTVVTLGATQTLTAKTLTTPIISSISNTGTVTLPTATDTLVARATTDTLTNKRITHRVSSTSGPGATPSMNTDNDDIFIFTALAAAITSMTTNLTGTPNDGDHLLVRFTDNGTARAITWGAKFGSSGVATLLATTVISKVHNVFLVWDATKSLWVCMAVDATGY